MKSLLPTLPNLGPPNGLRLFLPLCGQPARPVPLPFPFSRRTAMHGDARRGRSEFMWVGLG